MHERCEDLSTRLEAAEVEVEHAKAQERLAHDVTEKQSEALAEMRMELQQGQDTHCKCCADLASRLEVAQAGAVENARTKERLAEAESVVEAKQVQAQQLRDQSCSYKEARCFPMSSEAGASKAGLQQEKAVLHDRCEQLRQQLAKAEAKVDLLQGLREEIGMYKERLRWLERQLVETKRNHRLDGGISGHRTPKHHGADARDAAFGDQESDLAEQLGYSLVEEDRASVLSGASGCSKQNCFMLDAVFKSRMDVFREGGDLQKGSQVLAGDGKTVLEVVEISKEARATEVVNLQAGSATLRVTPDHPVQIPDERGEPGRHVYMPAGKLKAGDFVMLDSGEPVALTSAEAQAMECKVLKIVFKPDLSVAVFSSPSCILSKGHKKIPGAPQWHGRERQGLGRSDGWRSLDSGHGGRRVHGLSL